MAVDKIRNEIGCQRENQTNLGRAGNRLTDSGPLKRQRINGAVKAVR